MNGVVQSGGSTVTPIANAQVRLYQAYASSPMLIAQTVSNGDGSFSVPNASFKADSSFFFVTASLGDGILLMAILGPTVPVSIVINELTTVAATWSAAQFIVSASIQGDSFPLGVVAGMNANLVDVTTGASSTVMTTSPNWDETSAWRTTHSLANALAACVADRGQALELLFKAATPPGGTQPADTITALGNIARNPAHQAGPIYILSEGSKAYADALREQPVAWTIVVKVNDSGDVESMFGGPGSLVFDKQGRAWIPNNVIQGTGNSSPYGMVLDATGRPAVDATGKRMSPFSGGGVYGGGFGVDVDPSGNVWISDFGWGGADYYPPGSFSLLGSDASPKSPSEGYGVGVVHRVQGVAVDGSGNVWVSGWGNNVVACYPGVAASPPADPAQVTPATYTGDTSFQPFGIAIAADGTAWVTNSNSASSTVVRLQYDGTTNLQLLHTTIIGKTAKGIVIDKSKKIWVASGGDDHVYVLDQDGTVIGGYQGGGMYGPWGISLDGADNCWVGNFGPLEVGSVFHGRLTCLAGVNAQGYRLGDALTPPSGYRLPTAGCEVLLANHQPLYAGAVGPCYIPMMRTTGLNIDAAGNVWTCNNWKPDFTNDAFGDPFTGSPSNPGGDGLLIWVGVAAPK